MGFCAHMLCFGGGSKKKKKNEPLKFEETPFKNLFAIKKSSQTDTPQFSLNDFIKRQKV